MALGQLVVRLGLDAADFTQGMSRSEAEAQRFAAKLASDIASAATAVTVGLGAIAVGAAGAFKLINDQVENIAAFQQLSEKIGDTAQNLASLKQASDVSGVSMDSIAAASVKLTAALSKTDEEGQGAAKAIKALGLDFDAFKALAPVDQIEAVSTAMNGFEDGANKTAVAVALWGKSGAEMIPLLNDLADGSKRNITLTQDQITAADNFSKSISRLVSEAGTLKQQLVAQLVPTLQDLLNAFTQAGDGATDAANKSKPFASAMEFIRSEIKNTVADTLQLASGFSQLFTFIAGYGKVSGQLLSGNFEEAKRVGLQVRAEIDATSAKYDVLRQKALSAGDSARGKGFADPRLIGSTDAKPKLNFSGVKTPSAKGGAEKLSEAGGAEKLSEAQRYLEQLEKQLQTTQKLTVEEKLQQDILNKKISGINPVIQAQLIGAAKQIDAEKARGEATKLAEEIARAELEETQRTYEEGIKARQTLEAEGKVLRESVKTDLQIFLELQAKYNDLVAAGVIGQNTANLLIDKAKKSYEALTPTLINVNDLAKTGAESLSSGLADAIVQGKSLADVFKNVVKQLAAMILKALFFKALEIGLNAVSPGLGTTIAGVRASGGPVNAGKSYLVGEKGPELFSPTNSGRITSNAQTFKSLGSGGGQSGNVYNITAPGVSREEFMAGLNRSQAGAVSTMRDNQNRRRA
jgi:hypothetical protein